MKKCLLLTIAILFALVALACGANVKTPAADTPAPVETATLTAPASSPSSEQAPVETAPPENPADAETLWLEMDASKPFSYDLDGDGVAETVSIVVDEVAYITDIAITRDGTQLCADQIDAGLSFISCYIGNTIIGDGYLELYLTGDAASDDYETFVYRLTERGLQRAEMLNGKVLSASGDGLIQFDVPADMMGTYEATCFYRMDASMLLSLASDYTIVPYEKQYRTLTLKKDGLTAQNVLTGAVAEKLPAGTELYLKQTDLNGYALLGTPDGGEYRVVITQNTEEGWGWLIDGVPESEWFGEVPYAG